MRSVFCAVVLLMMASVAFAAITPSFDIDGNKMMAGSKPQPTPSTAGILRTFIAYCPTDATGMGSIVDIDPVKGNFTIITNVSFPSAVYGCIADYNPRYDFDHDDPNTLWFDFTSDLGFFLAVDTRFGNTTSLDSSSLFFTGFLNFKYAAKLNKLLGIAGAVTESGFCFDGCLEFGSQAIGSGNKFTRANLLPFKETADDTSFVNWAKNTFHFQAGYDLRTTNPCAPTSSDQCLLSIDMNTGKMLSEIYTPEYDVFKFGRYTHHGDNVAAFMVGFNEYCTGKDNTTSYAFGTVNLTSAAGTPTACIPQDVVIDTDEWIASYSLDESLVATGSGNGEGDPPQLLVFNVTTGKPTLNSQLKGVASALGADMSLIFVWALEFVQVVPV